MNLKSKKKEMNLMYRQYPIIDETHQNMKDDESKFSQKALELKHTLDNFYSKKDLPKILVFCIEGESGVGKSEYIIKMLQELYTCMKENFIPTLNNTNFEPQGFFAENYWSILWHVYLEKICETFYDKERGVYTGNKIIFTDRSPFSASIYCTGTKEEQEILKISAEKMIKEFDLKGIKIQTILVTDDYEKVKKQRLNRLKKEPERKKLQEGNEKRMKEIHDKYHGNLFNWDYRIDLSKQKSLQPHELILQTLQIKKVFASL